MPLCRHSFLSFKKKKKTIIDSKKLFFDRIAILSKFESVKFSLIESVICVFTDSSVKKIFLTVKLVNFY